MVYVNPRPTEAEIHSYYPEELYEPCVDPERLLREQELYFLMKYEYFKEMPPGRLLEIGCAKGEFMAFMKQHGWTVSGLDFSSKPPNLFGLDIRYGNLERAGYEEQSFDLVVLWAVLEHVYNPAQTLARINTLLKPHGKVVVLVTNFNSLPARFMRHDDIPRHTNLFTWKSLGRMLRQTGFRPERFYFNSELYGGSNRGVLNYLFKLAAGEKLDDIVEQNRSTGRWQRWQQFSSQLHGKDSKWMLKVDEIDRSVTPYLDRLCDRLRIGFIMTAKASKVS